MLAQEYGRYFGMKTGIFRGGCLTGPQHCRRRTARLPELPGARARSAKRPYTIFGYKGKQVRDQIHSHDVISAFWHFAQNPRPGEVYNLGGGKRNAASLLECVDMIARSLAARSRSSPTATRTASATTSATIPTSRSSASTIPSGSSRTRCRKSSKKWCD